ncbi:MAG: ATP-binding protein [Tabrizicola sp.]|nr:ATP-binding protein [Tabrizicola sp.]
MTGTGELYNTVAPLANVTRLVALVDRCQNRGPGLPGLGCFFGRAGLGKTTGGIYVTNTMSACHVEALPFGGLKKLLEMIVTELGLRPKRLIPDMFDQAAAELAVTGRPLIIDEADHILATKTIEAVRKLHDVSGAPVILMGEELLPQKLQAWERVHGRMLAWVEAEPGTIKDVEHLARVYARDVEIVPELREAVLTASRGSIRYISTNLAAIAEFAAVRGLVRMTLADWGNGAFHTGEPPVLRRGAVPAVARKGRAA